MNKSPIIEFENFSFQYFSQAQPTLHDIDLKIYPGEKILIVGPSGSGKSTLGNCINGLIPFYYKGESQGNLEIKEQETRQKISFPSLKVVGTVLQDSDGQFVGLTVGEDIAFAMENDCTPHDGMRERVNRVFSDGGYGWISHFITIRTFRRAKTAYRTGRRADR